MPLRCRTRARLEQDEQDPQTPLQLQSRPRSLTDPPQSPRPVEAIKRLARLPNTLQRTNPQRQSPLFARLPFEVRETILEYAVGCNAVGVVLREPGRFALAWATPTGCDTPRSMSTLLGPLLACRRLYVEAVDRLYAANRFTFTSPDALLAFPAALLPRRFALIRHVALDWSPVRALYADDPSGFAAIVDAPSPAPHDDHATWTAACALLAAHPALHTLAVRVHLREQQSSPRARWDRFAAPLRAVRPRGAFSLVATGLPALEVGPADPPFAFRWAPLPDAAFAARDGWARPVAVPANVWAKARKFGLLP